MTPEEIFGFARAHFGDAVRDLHADPKKDKDPWFVCEAAHIVDVATWLRDEPSLAFDSLECLTGIDYPDAKQIHVALHLRSYSRRHRTVMKVLLPREAPVMRTLSWIWPVAAWQERECSTSSASASSGTRILRRILLPDDWVGHPLRKDFAEATHYHGIPTTRPAPLELLKVGLPKDRAPAKPEKPA